MAQALICSESDLTPELERTVLWRAGVERQAARSHDQARVMALAARPQLVLVDRDLPRAGELVAALRQEASTRAASIAVLARGDFEGREVELLEAGANAVLRLPPGAEWDERLTRLMEVPARRAARLPVSFRVLALLPQGAAVSATALNVSRSGLLLETLLDALQVGSEVEMEVELPGAGDPLPAQGRVVRHAGPGQFGLQFLRLDEQARLRIDSFVRAAA